MRITRLTAIFVAIVASVFGVWGLDAVRANRTGNTIQDRDPMKPLQHVVASKTAQFGTVDKDDAAYKDALDAHERDGDLIVFDFDPNYRTAITAVLKNPDFPKFPDVKTLDGKEIVVSGKFVDYRGKAQIELTDPKQIKIVK